MNDDRFYFGQLPILPPLAILTMNWTTPLRPNAERAKAATTLIWIVLAAQGFNIVSSVLQYDLLQDIEAGVMVDDATITFNDLREVVLGLLNTALYIIYMVMFIRWFRRAYFNLHLRAKGLRHTEGWAAGGWFVPIISLFYPYQIMRELFDRMRQLIAAAGIQPAAPASGALLGWWWAVWIISGLVGQAAFRISLSAETLPELQGATLLDIVLGFVEIPLALLSVQVVRSCSKLEEQLAALPTAIDASETPVSGAQSS